MKDDLKGKALAVIILFFVTMMILISIPQCNKQECQQIDLSKYVPLDNYTLLEKYRNQEREHSDERIQMYSENSDKKLKYIEKLEKGYNDVVYNKTFLAKRLDSKSKCAYTLFKENDNDYMSYEDVLTKCKSKCSKVACDDFYKYFKRNED